MTIRELIELLSGYDPEMEVVARIAHCCGRHNYSGRSDPVHVMGCTDDAWWVPEVDTVRVAGYDIMAKEATPAREVLGIEGSYPGDENDGRLEDDEFDRRMCQLRRHEVSGEDEAAGEEVKPMDDEAPKAQGG